MYIGVIGISEWSYMETHEQPRWSLPLRLEPEVLAVGYSFVGIERVETYRPAPMWQLTLFEGPTSLDLRQGRQRWRLAIRPQDILIIPPNSVRVYTTERRLEHYYLEFRYRLEYPESAVIELPAVFPSGPSAAIMHRDFAACMDLRETDRYESDLLARLLLWRLVRIARTADAGQQDRAHIIEAVQKRIRENTADASLTPDALAEAVGYSRRRLDQLCVELLGKPVSACIRDRRAQLAEDLLRQSALPIHLIGAQVGIPDRHAFNKFMRRNRGKSPTAIRAGE
ncbi:MAG: helix-turn-helix domain-containing protein [Verrucomicrobia bacterium]|nr:helix-turn-helix domain-containing protein [Verrucomicrobiota bacterium]MBT7700105.1 helix-turn-helix domain-containing protein [Verrucomicrobiota bacterium]